MSDKGFSITVTLTIGDELLEPFTIVYPANTSARAAEQVREIIQCRFLDDDTLEYLATEHKDELRGSVSAAAAKLELTRRKATRK